MFYSSSKRRGEARDTSARKPLATSRGLKAIQSAIEPLETRVLMSTSTFTVTGLGDGAGLVTSSGTNTYTATTLRAAVTYANQHPFNAVINFSKGGEIKLNKALVLNNNAHTYTITGPTGANPIVIDGGGAVTDFIANTGVIAEFDNLTIQHGLASVTWNPLVTAFQGGGISSDGVLTLTNDNFIGNVAATNGVPGNSGAGGAVYSNTGNLTVTGGSFVGNSAGFGGGIFTFDGSTNESPTISNATFTGNTATGGGAAVQNDSEFNSTMTLNGDTFTSNAAVAFAPVTSLALAGSLTTNVTNSTFTNNSGQLGGALDTGLLGGTTTTLNVTNSTFTGNKSNSLTGGTIYSQDTTVAISGSTFKSNLATQGSGIYLNGNSKTVSIATSSFTAAQGTPVVDISLTDAVTATSDTFTNNTGTVGGGINTVGKSLTVSSSVFTGDTASAGSSGGAINYASANANATLVVDDAKTTGSSFGNDTSTTGNGGAIFSTAPTNTISNSAFTNNASTKGNGGAVDLTGAPADVDTFTADTFTGNQAVAGFGGAIFDGGGATAKLTVSGTFTSNLSKKGGAIDSVGGAGSTATVSGTFTTNTATTNGGGAIFSNDNTLNVSGTFTGNQALNSNGGAVDLVGANLNVTGSKFSNDLANGNGGGVFFNGVTGKILGSTFTGETAATGGNGGGLSAKSNMLTLTTDTFTNDGANNEGGGAFLTTTTEADISESTFNGDTAVNGGGGLFSTEPAGGSLLTIFNTTLNSDATSFGGGGGAQVGNTNATIANTTWSGNSAGNDVGGGGLALVDPIGGALITDSTFSLNTAGLKLGGGLSVAGGNATILDGDIIAGNFATGDPSTGNDIAGAVKGKFNLIGDSSNENGIGVNSVNNIVGDAQDPISALLAPLANNGGQTYTMALLANSPAIGNGGPFVVDDINGIDITAVDQRGVSRPQFPQGWDVGAYQSGAAAANVDVLSFLTVPSTATAGVATTVTVEATVNGTLDSGFNDTVSFTSSDGAATGLPQHASFVNGKLTFTPTFNTVGSQTITATDDNSASGVASVTSTAIVVSKVSPIVPVASIANPAPITKPTSGTVVYNFTVTLSSASSTATTIDYMTHAGTASSQNNDYVGVPAGVLVIPAGQLTGNIAITVNGNTKPGSLQFQVVITGTSSNVTLGNSTATGTINAGGVVTPTASIQATASITPAGAGVTLLNVVVTLSSTGPAGSSVTYATRSGSAAANGDYTGTAGTTVSTAGLTSFTITIPVKPHTAGHNTFSIVLLSATGVTLAAPTTCTVTIV